MATIRPLERTDLPAVAALLRDHLDGTADVNEELLKATLIDDPWADPRTPSLVAEGAGGRPAGFIGAMARRMRAGNRDLRAVCCSHLVVTPEARSGATGALLLRRLMAGPQDLTWSDTASDVVLRMWRAFGGWPDHSRSSDWMLALRPGRWLAAIATSGARRRGVGRELIPVGALPLHAAGSRLLRRGMPEPDDVTGRSATAAEIADAAASVRAVTDLAAAYDAAYLEHTFAVIERTLGHVEPRIVLRGGGPVGWYATVDRPGGASRLLVLGATASEHDAVLADATRNARARGRTVLAGRLEPQLEDPLRRRLAVLGLARRPVVHTRDPALRELLAGGSATIAQLDGEWFVT